MRRALTLVELLVVIGIIVLLTAVAVPKLKPALEQGRVREASRQLNAYVAMVKSRAVQLARPVGIWIERSEAGSNAALELFMAEMPEPYSGDSQGATVSFVFDDMNYNRGRWVAQGQPGAPIARRSRGFFFSDILTADPNVYSSLVDPGETFSIRFNFRGAVYQCTRDFNAWDRFVMQLGFVPPAGANGLGDDGTLGTADDEPGVPFQIFRSPKRAIARPLQLARGVIIDLEFSGMGLDLPAVLPTQSNRLIDRNNGPLSLSADHGIEFAALSDADDSPVVVMFNPGGTIERVVLQGQTYAPSGTVHLLIGEMNGLERDANDNTLKTLRADSLPESPNPIAWSLVDDTPVSYSANLAKQTNLWVSLGHRTGSVTTTENAWEVNSLGAPSQSPNLLHSLRQAREFAQRGETMGGR